jgi:hypothetical protein
MSTRSRLCVLLCLCACATPNAEPPVQGAAPVGVAVRGVAQPDQFTPQQLEALGGEDVTWTFRDLRAMVDDKGAR